MGNEKTELTEEEFLTAIKEGNLSDSLAKYTQKIGDKRTSEGIETFKKNLEKKDSSDSEKIINLENELKELKGTLSKKDIETQIKNELKTQNLNEGLIKYLRIEDPSKIAESVTDLKNDLLKIEQDKIDSKLKGNAPPVKGLPGNGGDTTLETYVENKNAGKVAGNPFEGKLDNKKGE
jgi:hypothetical protein